MHVLKRLLVSLTLSAVALAAQAAESGALHPQLEPLRPFLGRTWKGVFRNSTPQQPMIDVARWERALNGQAVRVLHSINGGKYGGESIIRWDPERKSLVYHYFTTAGFMTEGTMTVKDGKMSSREVVKGAAQGVEEVRSTSEIRADGTLVSKSEYLKAGKWEPGHEITYREAPDARVDFE